MSFKQSVLLPIKEYNKLLSITNQCQGKGDNLMNSDIPSDIKLRLIEQERILGMKKRTKPVRVSLDKTSLLSLRDKTDTINDKTVKERESNNDVKRDSNNDVKTLKAESNKGGNNEKNEVNHEEQRDDVSLDSISNDEDYVDANEDNVEIDESVNSPVVDKGKIPLNRKKPNILTQRKLYNTRSSASMLTKSRRAKLGRLGQQSLDVNNKLLEQYARANVKRKNSRVTKKNPTQEGRGFSWIVY
jgi:hypothetical protein